MAGGGVEQQAGWREAADCAGPAAVRQARRGSTGGRGAGRPGGGGVPAALLMPAMSLAVLFYHPHLQLANNMSARFLLLNKD